MIYISKDLWPFLISVWEIQNKVNLFLFHYFHKLCQIVSGQGSSAVNYLATCLIWYCVCRNRTKHFRLTSADISRTGIHISYIIISYMLLHFNTEEQCVLQTHIMHLQLWCGPGDDIFRLVWWVSSQHSNNIIVLHCYGGHLRVCIVLRLRCRTFSMKSTCSWLSLDWSAELLSQAQPFEVMRREKH